MRRVESYASYYSRLYRFIDLHGYDMAIPAIQTQLRSHFKEINSIQLLHTKEPKGFNGKRIGGGVRQASLKGGGLHGMASYNEDFSKIDISKRSHPNQRHYQTDTFTDYDDLRIIVRNATASGRYSIGLGDDTDAMTFEAEETSGDVLEDLTYDYDAEAFVQRNEHQLKSLNQPPIVGIFNAPPTIEPMNLDVHSLTRKRNRTEKEENLDSSRNNNFQMDFSNKLNETISSFADKVDRFMDRDQGCWKLFKEIPDFSDSTRFKVLELLNIRAKKIDFMEMSSEECSKWIAF
ncbi:hypothetical protein Syun_009662 [Stephania yunnanensis]|uniref:At2g29880-like C-terminal domain-containing protein n=1 Tax=Stephania yunnanensis TaxID=152371 RepID=A0AAP0KGJ6_9MAGN